MNIRHHTKRILKRSEKYTKVDMLYLTKGGFWLSTGQIFAASFSLLIAIGFANLVPPETFGTYKYIVAIISVLSIATVRGLNTAYSQAVARGYEGVFKLALKTKIKWGFIGLGGSFVLAAYYYLNDNTTLAISFSIVALFIPFFETFNLYSAFFAGKKLFKKSAQYYFISRFVSFASLIFTIYLTDNLFYILLAYLLPLTLIQLILLLSVFRKYSANDKDDGIAIPYGKHISFIGVIGGVTRYLDNLTLFHYMGAAPLAAYALAIAPVDQVAALYKGLVSLIVPKLSKKSGQEIQATFLRRFIMIICVSAVFATLYVLLVPHLFRLLFPLYTDAIIYSQLLAGVLFFRLPLSFLNGIIQSRLDITPKSFLYWRIVPRIIFIISLFILTPLYGIFGVIISRIILSITSVVNLLIQWKYLSKIEREPKEVHR